MTAIRTQSGQRQVHFSQELEFVRDYLEGSGTLLVAGGLPNVSRMIPNGSRIRVRFDLIR